MARKKTTPAPEETKAPEATPAAPEDTQQQTPPPAPAPEQEQPNPAPAPTPDPEAVPEPFTPYQATVAIPLVVVRKGTTPNGSKPIGTLGKGARVNVTASVDGYAILDNGTHVKEAYLERIAP